MKILRWDIVNIFNNSIPKSLSAERNRTKLRPAIAGAWCGVVACPVGSAFSRSAPWHTYRRNPTPHHAVHGSAEPCGDSPTRSYLLAPPQSATPAESLFAEFSAIVRLLCLPRLSFSIFLPKQYAH